MVVWIHNIWSFPTKRKNNFFWRRTILRREILSIKMSTPKSNVFSRRKISRLKILNIKYSNCLPQNCPSPKINTMIRGRTKNNQNSCFFLVFATFVFFHFNKKRETAIFTRKMFHWKLLTKQFFFFECLQMLFLTFLTDWRLTLIFTFTSTSCELF